MKLVCIDNKGRADGERHTNLTVDKVYDDKTGQINMYKAFYIIKDDKGEYNAYHKSRFITLQEWRENKIKEILK